MSGQVKVIEWISKNFNLGEIRLRFFPSLPYGHIVKDKKGIEMLVFYDLLSEKVCYCYSNDSKVYKVN